MYPILSPTLISSLVINTIPYPQLNIDNISSLVILLSACIHLNTFILLLVDGYLFSLNLWCIIDKTPLSSENCLKLFSCALELIER